jgi:DNA-binding LytR/AlgR family response regulator
MDTSIKILVVEDEMLIGAKISMLLTNLGYEVTGILPRGEDALIQVEENKPDIIVLDIYLKGKIDGIETATILQQKNIPVIYLTANSDDATFNRAKLTRPTAFISKPFKQLDLQRAIELTIIHLAETDSSAIQPTEVQEEQPFILIDRIFVRYNGKMIKIMLTDILYMEADRNYSRIFTTQKEYVLSVTLKYIEEKLRIPFFLRIHRSYLVNMLYIDQVLESDVMIGDKAIPLGAGMREKLMQRMQTL